LERARARCNGFLPENGANRSSILAVCAAVRRVVLNGQVEQRSARQNLAWLDRWRHGLGAGRGGHAVRLWRCLRLYALHWRRPGDGADPFCATLAEKAESEPLDIMRRIVSCID